MKLAVKEQIKTLLAQRGMKQKDLAVILTEKTGRNYTPDTLSHRLNRGTVTYNEVLLIADILNFDINFVSRDF